MAALTEHGAAPNTAPNGLAEHGKDDGHEKAVMIEAVQNHTPDVLHSGRRAADYAWSMAQADP